MSRRGATRPIDMAMGRCDLCGPAAHQLESQLIQPGVIARLVPGALTRLRFMGPKAALFLWCLYRLVLIPASGVALPCVFGSVPALPIPGLALALSARVFGMCRDAPA